MSSRPLPSLKQGRLSHANTFIDNFPVVIGGLNSNLSQKLDSVEILDGYE